tara:strand:+ start:1423 stop:3252 length:1830 start_codon:yes stop_codon:yes gene_type:complete
MTDFSYSITPDAKGVGEKQTLWSFHGVNRYPGPSGTVILHKRRGDRRHFVQPDVANALGLCAPFQTLEHHTRNIVEALPELSAHVAHTEQTLRTLAEAGLFESSEACWQRLTTTPAIPEHDSGCRVFILTCDRPEALQRLLSRLSRRALPAAVEGIWVIDDSREEFNAEHNAQIIASFSSELSSAIHHVDAGKRNHLIERLKTALPQHSQSIDWLLAHASWGDHPTYGMARNFSLLLSVGKRALVLDDDIIPEGITPPLAATPLRFGGANQREAGFYASREALAQHTLRMDASPLALMLHSLGEPLGTIIPQHLTGHSDLMGFDGSFFSEHDGSSRALVSQCGSWGDPGTGQASWTIHLNDASIKRLLETSADIEAVLGSRSGWLGYRGPVLSHYATLSQLTGLDHSALLPPYLPAGRGEDILFGIMLQRLHPESVVLNQGWAIHHDPMEDRAERGVLTPLTVKLSTSLLGDWLGKEPIDQWGLPVERRLIGLAEQLRRLGDMTPAGLTSLIHQELVSQRSLLLSRCFEQLGKASKLEASPGFAAWKQFLEASRDQLVSEIQSADEMLFNSSGSNDLPSDLAHLQKQGGAFADAVIAWPEICKVAATID